MSLRNLTTVKSIGWILLGSSLPVFILSYYSIGPDWFPLIAVSLLVIGIYWWLKAVPTLCHKFRFEEEAKQQASTLSADYQITGNEEILRTSSILLQQDSNRKVLFSENDEVIGGVVGTYEMGHLWVTAIGSDENEYMLLHLRCANPGAWWRYGYKRKVKWHVLQPYDKETIGIIELRPTFLGRFKWPITTETDMDFGQVKAGVEWNRMMMAPAGALVAHVIPNLGHHATVFMQSRPVCAVSWSGQSAALTFAPGEWEYTERQLSIAVAVLTACCPMYYRNA